MRRRRGLTTAAVLANSVLGAGVLMAGAAAGTAIALGERRVVLTEHRVALRGLPAPFEGLRIVQLSDLHATVLGSDHADLLAAVDAARPDLVVLTGDVIDRSTSSLGPTLDLLAALLRRAPVHAVTGNHEGGTHLGTALAARMQALGVRLLRDEMILLERDGTTLALAGVDDPRVHGGPPSSFGSPAIDRALMRRALQRAGLPAEGPVVLLAHRPELLEVYADHGADLVLVGHAHGGQWRVPGPAGMPGSQGLYAPNQGLLPARTGGLHRDRGTVMAVSRGLKVRTLTPRLNNPPEVVVVELARA